jgi:hypothetical protein
MAHSCPECGLNCHCGGDIDDCEFDGTIEQMRCRHCEREDEQPAWRPAKTIRLHPELHSEATKITRLLLAMPRYGDNPPIVEIGWYLGGLMNVFRVDGSPNNQHPTHWMPLPDLP